MKKLSKQRQLSNAEKIRVAWLRGVLYYKLRPYQKEVYNKLREIEADPKGSILIFVNASRQTGKSLTCGGIVLLEDCIRNPNTYTCFITATKQDAKDIIRKVMRPLLDDCPDDIKPKWNGSEFMYEFQNGSELAVLGADDKDQIARVRGRPRKKSVVDEARNIRYLDDLVESVLLPSALTTQGHVLLTTTPPNSPSHKSKDYYEQSKQNGSLIEYTIWDAQKSCPDIFNKEYIDRLAAASGGYQSTAFRREYEVMWVVESERAIVPEWSHIIEEGPPPKTLGNVYTKDIPRDKNYSYYKKYTCMDMGTRHATWTGYAYWDFKRAQLIVEDEWWTRGSLMTTELVANMILEKEKELWGNQKPDVRIADNNNLQMLQDLSLIYKVIFTGVSKTKDGRTGSLESHVNRLREWVTNGRIIINPRCQFLLGCLESGIWTETRDRFDTSRQYYHYDAIAGLMYLLKYVDRNTNPVPWDVDIDYSDPSLIIRKPPGADEVDSDLQGFMDMFSGNE